MRKNMKMADLLGIDYRLLTVIYRLGIKLGFGEKTVEETCRESESTATPFSSSPTCTPLRAMFPQRR